MISFLYESMISYMYDIKTRFDLYDTVNTMSLLNFQFMGAIMGMSTTVQFRTDTDMKQGAIRICEEMGMSLSTAMQLFIKELNRRNGMPFIITANTDTVEEKEEGYDEWLRARLESTIKKLDSGEMKTYTTDEVRARLKVRRAESRKNKTSAFAN
jgi:DNA-damage-inducible protein J